jgi:hypothetical protein
VLIDLKLALVSSLLLVITLVSRGGAFECGNCLKRVETTVNASSRETAWGRYLPVLIFFAAITIIVLRDASLLASPRFWAEDGYQYFKFAYSNDWLDTLLFRQEYRLILSNIPALISTRLLPIELAPLPFSLIWLFIVSAALAIVAWGNSPVWDTPLKKIIVSAIIIFAPRSAEIWLNANGTQYYTALITALILAESMKNSGRLKKYSFRLLLVLGSLNGVLSCLLAPLYWIKALKNRDDREILIQAAILSTGIILQIAAILMSPYSAPRDILSSPYIFGLIAGVKSFGITFSTELSYFIYHNRYEAVGYAIILAWVSFLAIVGSKLKNNPAIYLLGAYILIFVFSSIFGIGGNNNLYFTHPVSANRYFYVPSVLLLISLFASISPFNIASRVKSWTMVAAFLVLMGMVNGIEQYRQEKVSSPAWPDWQEEIAKWKKDESHWITIWPAKKWVFQLEHKTNQPPHLP